MTETNFVKEIRFFVASPLIALAKIIAWVAAKIGGEEVVCFAIREATEIDEDNIDVMIRDIEANYSPKTKGDE